MYILRTNVVPFVRLVTACKVYAVYVVLGPASLLCDVIFGEKIRSRYKLNLSRVY